VAGQPSLRRKRITDQEIDRIRGFNPYTLLPWVLLVIKPLLGVLDGHYPRPVVAMAGLGLFVLLYVGTVLSAFLPRFRDGRPPMALALLMVPVTGALAGSLPSGPTLYPLLAIACATVVPNRAAPLVLLGIPALAALTSSMRGDGGGASLDAAWTSLLPGAIVFVVLKLFSVVDQLKETRGELARAAVAEERLRFSRDLHDLLGHSMSVVALKAEAVRRLAPTDLGAALAQAEDIGYRATGLAEELLRARSLLSAARIEPVVRESGPPLPTQAEGLLAWVVREGVTNVVRHGAGVRHCEIDLDRGSDPVRLTISDDGTGRPAEASAAAADGNGLRGLTERVAAAGGTLRAGPSASGFRLLATLPAQR
jgi:two-component system sensor histidine kinase DesK